MELQEVLLKRRSIRKFKSEKVSKEAIDALLHAAMSGPSALNKKPWKFYVVSSEEKLEELRNSSQYSNRNAPLAIVVCGDLKECIEGKREEYWIQDCSAATENILLKATELGLGSLWCGIYLQDESVQNVSNILGLNKNEVPLNIIYIGYADEYPEARDQYDESKIKYIE